VPEKTSLQLYEWWMEAAQKFDYFMAGISTALAGYLGQSFRPERLGWSPGLPELLSLLCFVAASVASLKRVESTVHALRLNQQQIEKGEVAAELAEAIESKGPIRGRATREEIDPAVLRQAHSSQKDMANIAKQFLEKTQRRAQYWYAARTYLLLTGFLLLIAARVWQAYS